MRDTSKDRKGWTRCTVRIGGRWYHEDGSSLEAPLVRGKIQRAWVLTMPDKTQYGPFVSFCAGKAEHLKHSVKKGLAPKPAPKGSVIRILQDASKLRDARLERNRQRRKTYYEENREWITDYQRRYYQNKRKKVAE